MTDPSRGGTRKIAVAALLCALAVSGCATSPPSAHPAEPRRPVGAASPGTPNATEVGWIQLTIAMDDQARRILELAPQRSGSARMKDWAAETAARHRARLAVLRTLLAGKGIPDDNPHEGHDMPGMVDAQEMRALQHARGLRFDRLLRSALIEHLDQSRQLAAAVRKTDAGADVKEVALATDTSAAKARRQLPPA
ncbi:DUF305 domain-containing protein [Streptomyces dubilierae]|uniref:DUF305 domain-containing protein n=1 Tax=Streptomyces dubilierae TaxID=3075533 RepID=A0ABU2P2X5_9ACTN|nr:DUF305 domain-containing protein [Streptomyces sp. DSM 41921]MDT0386236.1 DUF305 domain-containing protein [Streptomyces sp. DSM 41921]